MSITLGEAYMFHRLAPRPFSARVLYGWSLLAVGMSLAAAIAFVSSNRIHEPAIDTTAAAVGSPTVTVREAAESIAAAVGIPTMTVSEAAESVGQATAAGENGFASEPTAETAAPFVPSHARKVRAVSPRARAEMPRAVKRTTERTAFEFGLAPLEKSFTGAGRAFDAVH
jgi:uncharacterized membrane protein YraQ (UPF0718 family)